MFNRRALIGTSISAAAALALSACGSDASNDEPAETNGTITIAATPVPHAAILEFVAENLAESAGLDIKIQEFTDYVQPNLATDDGSVNANFFQHLPYLEQFNRDNGTDLTALVPVHIEPLGLYAERLDSVDAIGEGAQIAIPSDATNGGRALALLADAGLIELQADVEATSATVDDIAANPLGLDLVELEAAQLPRSLADVDAAVINGNYALEVDLSPAEDALFSEVAENNPYANYLVVATVNADNDDIATLAELLQSDEVRTFIEQTYTDGSVVPAF